jgi:hypothetical protein
MGSLQGNFLISSGSRSAMKDRRLFAKKDSFRSRRIGWNLIANKVFKEGFLDPGDRKGKFLRISFGELSLDLLSKGCKY